MSTFRNSIAARIFAVIVVAALALGFSGCATLGSNSPVRIHVVGLDSLPGQGLEVRFNLKLRVQNPNDSAIDYDGIAVDLDLNGRNFASGVSNEKGSIERFGEAVISVPITVSAFSVVRQVLGFASNDTSKPVPYTLRAKLGGALLGGMRFEESGTLDFPALAPSS